MNLRSFDFQLFEPDRLGDVLKGVHLFHMPKLTLGNAENYRVRSLLIPEITAFPVHSRTPIIPAEIVHIFLIQRDVISTIFSGNIDAFRGTETNMESSTYAVDARGAGEKHH